MSEKSLSSGFRTPSAYGFSDLVVVPNGSIWVATVEEGLYYFEGGTWTHYTAEGLPDNNIRGLACDAQNHLWVIGPDSLGPFDGQTWRLISIDEHERSPRQLNGLVVTPPGEFWLSVPEDGLYQLSQETWTHHSQETREDWDNIMFWQKLKCI